MPWISCEGGLTLSSKLLILRQGGATKQLECDLIPMHAVLQLAAYTMRSMQIAGYRIHFARQTQSTGRIAKTAVNAPGLAPLTSHDGGPGAYQLT
jgi:hypothetical protein